ncbi:MAG: hypothetical protein AAGG68_26070, partial [Bacteroidota bacterium]
LMSFLIQYRTLFEVKILHDYYLDRVDSRFLKLRASNEAGKETEIKRRLSTYDIRNDLDFEPTAASKKFMNAHKMLFRATPTGFLVATKVKRQETNEGIRYQPFIALESQFSIAVQLKVLNPIFQNFTALPLRTSIDTFYYFSNKGHADQSALPLSLPVPVFKTRQHYEMGSLVKRGNRFFEAIKNTSGQSTTNTSFWEKTENHQQATSSDKRLVYTSYKPKYFLVEEKYRQVLVASFDYTFPIHISENAAEFKLLDAQGEVGVITTEDQDTALRKVRLTFEELKVGAHTLKVKAGSFTADYEILIDDKLFDEKNTAGLLGVVEIAHQADLEEYRLLETDGKLRVEDEATTFPVFEIRLRNRSTYWKYVPLNGQSLSVDEAVLKNETINRQSVYVSTNPQPFLAQSKIDIGLLGANADVKLPNAHAKSLQQQPEEDRYFSEIFLPKMAE